MLLHFLTQIYSIPSSETHQFLDSPRFPRQLSSKPYAQISPAHRLKGGQVSPVMLACVGGGGYLHPVHQARVIFKFRSLCPNEFKYSGHVFPSHLFSLLTNPPLPSAQQIHLSLLHRSAQPPPYLQNTSMRPTLGAAIRRRAAYDGGKPEPSK